MREKGNRRRDLMLHVGGSARVGESGLDSGLEVSPSRLQRALLDGVDSPGTPGQVLTSRGPGVAPTWAAGGGGSGGTGGTGDVVGPAVSVVNDVALFADTTGKLLKDGGKLAPVAFSGAYADLTGAPTASGGTDLTYTPATRLLESSTGADVTLPLATTTVAGLMSGADKTKLDGAASDADLTALENQVNALPSAVTPDWNAAAGAPGEILNKPPLGTAAAEDVAVANGVCPLDASAKVPAIHLPSYVDDVVEVANQAALPATGEADKIYITADTGKIYRWSGTQYVEIVGSPGTTDDVPEGASNLYYTDARAEAAAQDVVDAALAANPPYVLPKATATVLGGVKIGSGIDVAVDGTISAAAQAGTGTDLTYTAASRLLESSTGNDVTLPLASTTVDGLMAAADKVKVNGAASDADLTVVENSLSALQAQVDALPAAVKPDWNAAAGTPAEILNKPAIPDSPDDIGAASQSDLDALEAIVAAIPAPVKPDWNAAAGTPAEILNKPPLGTAAAEDVGVANGVCPLDASAKVPAIHLPSFVDDVIEVADVASLPATGESDIIYVTADTDKVYRWTGTGYVEISPSPGTTDDVPEGASNLYYTDARAEAVVDANITAYDAIAKTQFMPLDIATLPALP
jgi:hypothetical protein